MTCNFKDQVEDLCLEVTVLSAEALKPPPSTLLPFRLRPYVTLSPSTVQQRHHDEPLPLYRTRVDSAGTANPAWGDTIRVPVNRSFLIGGNGGGRHGCSYSSNDATNSAAVHVSVLSLRPLGGPTPLGWCEITPEDVLDGFHRPGAQRRLSFALRSSRDGGRGCGVIHMAVRLVGPHLDHIAPLQPPAQPGVSQPSYPSWGNVVIGFPVTVAAAAASTPVAAFHAPALARARAGGIKQCDPCGASRKEHVGWWRDVGI